MNLCVACIEYRRVDRCMRRECMDGGARSAHQSVAPPHSNTQATLTYMRSIARRVSQKEDSLAAVTHDGWGTHHRNAQPCPGGTLHTHNGRTTAVRDRTQLCGKPKKNRNRRRGPPGRPGCPGHCEGPAAVAQRLCATLRSGEGSPVYRAVWHRSCGVLFGN